MSNGFQINLSSSCLTYNIEKLKKIIRGIQNKMENTGLVKKICVSGQNEMENRELLRRVYIQIDRIFQLKLKVGATVIY